jgi:hypothetical protein
VEFHHPTHLCHNAATDQGHFSSTLDFGLYRLNTMNPLERSLIDKAGYAKGWENVRESTPARVVLFSARAS